MGSCLSTDDSEGEVGCGRAARAKRKLRKRQAMEVLAAEAKSNELLARMPGRMCTNGASRAACIFTQQGRKGTNQDAMVVWENYATQTDTIFCGVFDGHGPYGHLVARKVRDSLPSKLISQWKALMRGDRCVGSCLEEEEDKAESNAAAGLDSKPCGTFPVWKEAFLKAYNVMDKELLSHPTIDCFYSGTTAVTMLKQGEDLVIGNVGDSRAILGTLTDENTLEAVQLTIDLKPNLPMEAERIKRCKGRVFALEDEPEVARVWLPHDDSPGLAMARAFGDFCLKDFGLIAVPEITYRRLTRRDQFVVLATDGVWDVLSNKEVVEVISTAPTRTTAARALVETAVRAWRLKYPTSKVDDCAVVCLYLNHTPPPSCELKLSAETDPKTCSSTTVEREIMVASEGGDDQHPAHLPPPPPEAEGAELGRSNTVRSGSDAECDIQPADDTPSIQNPREKNVERSVSRRSLAECLSTADDDEWSALEGVTRVNSLLNLPRFLGGDKRSGAIKRRH